MKRELTKEEREMTEKGIERNRLDLDKLNYNLKYNKALMDKQEYLRAWDDAWRQPERDRKDIEDNDVIKMIESEIKLKQEAIEQGQKHINEGVEVKRPLGLD